MPVVWVVEDERFYRETAERIIGRCAAGLNLDLETVLWDGRDAFTEEERAKPPDLVILDLNLNQGINGLEALEYIPGFEGANPFHPYVIIWSHFDGELAFSDMSGVRDSKTRLREDRMHRTYWKSETNLETALNGFLNRLLEEGVLHGEISP